MPEQADPKRQAILEAAQVQFSRYGFRRTSMQDIAKETGVSRASLYSHFENKEQIFRELSVLLHEVALGDAERHLKNDASDSSLQDRIEEALAAKLGRLHDFVSTSPHGSEIVDENNRLCGDVVSSSSSRFQEMLARAFEDAERAGRVKLEASGLTPDSAAELLRLAASGLKHGAVDAEAFRRRLHPLVRVFFAGLR